MFNKINAFFRERKEDLYVFLIVILVACLSFGLGRLSVLYGGGGKIKVLYPENYSSQGAAAVLSVTASETASPAAGEGPYVASKSGKAYYLEGCSGVSRIKPENIIHFKTKESAEAAGYRPAANCPGL